MLAIYLMFDIVWKLGKTCPSRPYTSPACRSYFLQPDFIYFHSVIILLQVDFPSSVACFKTTLHLFTRFRTLLCSLSPSHTSSLLPRERELWGWNPASLIWFWFGLIQFLCFVIQLSYSRQNIKSNIGRFFKLFIILGEFQLSVKLLKTSLIVRVLHFWRFLLDWGHPLNSTGTRVQSRENLRIPDICRSDWSLLSESDQKCRRNSIFCFKGVLLFLVLVCNKQVLSTLCRNRCRYRYWLEITKFYILKIL